MSTFIIVHILKISIKPRAMILQLSGFLQIQKNAKHMKSITEEDFIRRKFYNKKENEKQNNILTQTMKACQDDLNENR